MNIEYEGGVNESPVNTNNLNPATAVGEFFYGPESMRLFGEILDTTGRIFSTALSGTLMMASVASLPTNSLASQTPNTGESQSIIGAPTGGSK